MLDSRLTDVVCSHRSEPALIICIVIPTSAESTEHHLVLLDLQRKQSQRVDLESKSKILTVFIPIMEDQTEIFKDILIFLHKNMVSYSFGEVE